MSGCRHGDLFVSEDGRLAVCVPCSRVWAVKATRPSPAELRAMLELDRFEDAAAGFVAVPANIDEGRDEGPGDC